MRKIQSDGVEIAAGNKDIAEAFGADKWAQVRSDAFSSGRRSQEERSSAGATTTAKFTQNTFY